ncbi:hypothetical protein F4556_005096 [Kitasatospora gansuensis]|uniref:Uncharacterized protein n=1 Tax=Kitasatospora gansuensis TaxID=258050 RepID=A0A7W7WJQ6_9ACTN|nr:hypothetical protein [Kitasatospora gansuensis]MBB4949561.1 hypothetical protein [Kitasatospora gansuensis]
MPDTRTDQPASQLDTGATDFDLQDLADATAKALGPQWRAERLTEELGTALGLNEELPAIRHSDGFAVTFEGLPPDYVTDIEPVVLAASVHDDLSVPSALLEPAHGISLADCAAQTATAVRALRAQHPARLERGATDGDPTLFGTNT